MTDSREPSYYEIALTNRQVLVAFVVILSCVLAAFLSGVWLGRGGALPRSETVLTQNEEAPEGGELAKLEELRFFSEDGETVDGRDKPDLSTVLDKSDPSTTLAEDVRAASAQEKKNRRRANRQANGKAANGKEADGKEDDGETADVDRKKAAALAQDPDDVKPTRRETKEPVEATPPPTKTPPPPPPPAKATPPSPAKATPPPPPPPAAAEPVDGFIIQVLSTGDAPKARRILSELKSAGYPVYLSPREVSGQTMYRVRVGPFDAREEADKRAVEVNERFKLDTWVTGAEN